MLTTRKRNDDARCIGEDPLYFDTPECFTDALEICNDCPVRLWCLQLVDPANNWADGVIGGHVWSNGAPVYDPTRANDPVLLTYMNQATGGFIRHAHTGSSPTRDDIDHVAIQLLIDGRLSYLGLTKRERHQAALLLHAKGVNMKEIERRCHVSSRTIYKALNLPEA